jgi:hypothetical protein
MVGLGDAAKSGLRESESAPMWNIHNMRIWLNQSKHLPCTEATLNIVELLLI